MANTALTGTYSVDDLLAVRNASSAEYGVDKIFDTLQRDLAFYNGMVNEQMSLFAEPLTEQVRTWGSSNMHRMTQVDEYGVAPSQKAFGSADVSFPLRLFSSSIGWTQKYLDIASPSEIMSEYLGVRSGHSYEINQQIAKAIYNNTNASWVDRLTNGVTLTIRRFLNADSQAIPDYNGVSFTAASHTHYNARVGTLAKSDINSLISHVTEHGHTKGLMLVVSLTDKNTLIGLGATSGSEIGFTALGYNHMVYNASDTTKISIDNTDLNNQLIGFWGDVQVWVKPYAIANYILCITSEGEKALGFRQRAQSSLRGLRLVSEIPGYPLVSKSFEAEFGVAVNCRTAGAVLYIGDTTWANPTIT